MLKITKGLKKKKKDKKGKHKEEELFEEAELEQYRKEQEEKRRQQAEAGKEGETQEKGEEWEKFKALTSGVDSILRKTQGDLDRIKSTSYFQRKPTPSELASEKEQAEAVGGTSQVQVVKKKDKKWVGFEDGTVDLSNEEETQQNQTESASNTTTEQTETHGEEEFKEELQKEEDDEEEFQSEEEEDIFDTSYVDAVASGEVKLAYIPDSPTENEGGFDPFDTSIADQLIKEDPAGKKRRDLVSLSCAVDVLTGKAEKPTFIPPEVKPKRNPRRQKPRDLLLASFDEGDKQDSGQSDIKSEEPAEPIKTLLDDGPLNNEDIELDLTINLATSLQVASPNPQTDCEQEQQQHIKSILNEFDAISNENQTTDKLTEGNIQEGDNNELEDEFAELAAASLVKEVTRVSPLTVLYDSHKEDKVSGENILKPARPPPPVKETPTQENCIEDDPFDTSFAAEILPGKCELKLIEEEILKSSCAPVPSITAQLPKSITLRDPVTFDEHNLLDNDVQEPLTYKHRDLLGGSTTDLSKITHSPIEPALISDKPDQELSYCDPFDTSIVNDLVAPGKTELKFLEKELLTENVAVNVIEENDDEFDPRADILRRKSVPRPEQLLLNEKRQSLSKVVAFKVESVEPIPDLLSSSNNETRTTKPLTPYYAEPKRLDNELEDEVDRDPFDTSFVSSTPGKLELKLIESELVGVAHAEPVQNLKRPLSDLEFDPRGSKPVVYVKQEAPKEIIQEQQSVDILSEDVQVDTKLHTPVVPKRIEEELDLNYTDPFDTSIAQHILPGKTELKLLENELIEAGSIKRSYTDPDFDPRIEPNQRNVPQSSAEVDLTQQPITDKVVEKPLTPLAASASFTTQYEDEVDPFDTTCVGSLIPGKVELKLLESELILN